MTPRTPFLLRCAILTSVALAATACTASPAGNGAPASAPAEVPSSAAPSTTPSEPAGATLPQSDAPLPDDEMVWRHKDRGSWSISTVNTRGLTGPELVVGHSNVAASLSRDRRTVLYLRHEDDDHTSLRAASADGGSDVRLFTDGSTDCPQLRRPALGPDGTIAVVCSPYDRGDDDFLNIMTTQGKLVKRLDVGQIGDPTFSPDGTRLVYARDRYVPYANGGALFSIPVDGSDSPTRLVTGANLNPVWSPEGDEVVFVHLEGNRRSLSAVRVNADGQGGGTQTLTTGARDQDPSWSPDGSRIVFRRGVGEEHLYVMSADGDAVRRVVRGAGSVTAPVWTA
ncbi:MAG TPA: hypothetical protein VGC37_15650, partial [Friedmanniella sp.]